ncbi:MAG: mechanosensitive ion channel [Spirochaetaceae bacterium]|nr:mechanosensitive ion channel [Spirochaetaceae bacterium]MCF7949586.1 mechanosensitive ion channel [Spirochaetia bacterium]MCF7952364.1 mechanosensitive ion channel [Spirochaetaceae bacterium]
MDIDELLNQIFSQPLQFGVLELPFNLLELMLRFLLPLMLITGGYRLLIVSIRRLLRRSSLKEEIQQRVLRWMRLALRLCYIAGIGLLIGRLFGAKIFEYFQIFYAVLNQPLINTGNTRVTFITVLLTIPVFYLASWAGRTTRGMMRNSLFIKMGLDEAQQFSISSLARYTVMVLVLLIGLSIIGIDLSALTVIFGVLGIGLGFGLQSVVSNFFSGLIIIITRPVKEGDRILVQGIEGTILQIRILATVINTLTNESIIVPNSQLVQESVHNFSFYDPSIIIKNEIGVAYSSDIDQVLKVLQDIAERNPYRYDRKKCWVYLNEFGDSSINLTVYTWIKSANEKFAAHHWNNLEIWRMFKEHNIQIPFPQLDLHYRSKFTE